MENYTDDSLLPLSGLQHFAFCRRQWALIHIERQWEENLRTVEGRHLHEKVHSGLDVELKGAVLVARSVPLVSYKLGLYGVADVVEFHPSAGGQGVRLPGRDGVWRVHPVEYKRGRPKPDHRDEVQLCAQAMCLEEMLGAEVRDGSFFYGETRRRLLVRFSASLRNQVESLAREMHDMFARGVTPSAPPGVRCSLCSLKDLCLPQLTRRPKSVQKYLRTHLELDSRGV